MREYLLETRLDTFTIYNVITIVTVVLLNRSGPVKCEVGAEGGRTARNNRD